MKQLEFILSEIEKYKNIKEELIENENFMPELSSKEKLLTLKGLNEKISQLEENTETIIMESSSLEGYEMLQEVNIRRLDKITQRKLRTIFIAIQLAKKDNDPLYTKYARGVMLRKTSKELIMRKYGNKAYQLAIQEESIKNK